MSTRRKVAVWSLVGLATVLPRLVADGRTKRQLLNTDAWTNTSAQMLADPTIRNAVSNKLVENLFQRVDVAGELRAQLPKGAQGIAPAAAVALQTAAVRAPTRSSRRRGPRRSGRTQTAARTGRCFESWRARRSVRSPPQMEPWSSTFARCSPTSRRDSVSATSSRRAHLRPQGRSCSCAPISSERHRTRCRRCASSACSSRSRCSPSSGVDRVARGHRRTILQATGAALVVVGLILLVVRRVAGNAIVDSVVNTEANRPPIRIAWLLETAMLRDIALGLVLYGIFALLGAWVAGPSRPAVASRAGSRRRSDGAHYHADRGLPDLPRRRRVGTNSGIAPSVGLLTSGQS